MLAPPPMPRLVPEDVFDAFGWCASDALEWRRPADRWDPTPRLDGSDPARMGFLLRGPRGVFPPALGRPAPRRRTGPRPVGHRRRHRPASRATRAPAGIVLARGRQPQRALLGAARLGPLPQ